MVEVGRVGRLGSQAEVMAGSDGGNFHIWKQAAHHYFIVFTPIIPNITLPVKIAHTAAI